MVMPSRSLHNDHPGFGARRDVTDLRQSLCSGQYGIDGDTSGKEPIPGQRETSEGQTIVSTTPPSTRSAAPVVADAWGEAT